MSLRRILPARYGIVNKHLRHISSMTAMLIDNCEMLLEGLEYDRTKEVNEKLSQVAIDIREEAYVYMRGRHSILDDFVAWLEDKIGDLTGGIEDALSGLYDWIVARVKKPFSIFKSNLDSVWTNLSSSAEGIATTVGKALNKVVGNITSGISDFLSAVKEDLDKAVTDVFQWSQGFIDVADDFMTPLGKMLALGFNVISSTLRDLLEIDIGDIIDMQKTLTKRMQKEQMEQMKTRLGV